MEKTNSNNYNNSVKITGNISSIGEVKQKSNGNNFMYINIAQNSKDGRASFYPLYLDGVMLEEFNKKNLQIGDRISAVGKLESYQKDSKQAIQIRPFEINKVEKQIKKEYNQTSSKENSTEIDM